MNCTDAGCPASCEFPYRFDNATSGCASAADLLGDAFTAYNLAFTWAVALLLFRFLRSWLFNLRERAWHFDGHPSTLMPLLFTIVQFLSLIEAIDLHLLRWSTRIWASLARDLFVPCAFSALLVYVHHARPRPQAAVPQALGFSSNRPKMGANRGIARRLSYRLGHAVPWALGLALSVRNATAPTPLAEGAAYVYIVPFDLILVAEMARGAWSLRTAPDQRSLQRRLIGMCSLLGLISVYLTVRGMSILIGDGGQSPRPTPVTFPFESMPVPIAKVVGSTLALLHYGRPRTDTDACQKSRYLDPLTLAAAHVAVLAGLMTTGFVVVTPKVLDAVFLTCVTLVPALFVAALGAQLLRARPVLERSDDDTAALIAQCKADLSRARSIPIVVKQLCTGSFLLSLSLKMGPARADAGGSSAAFQVLTMLVELESLFEWMQDHRRDLSIGVLATYFALFGSFVLLRLLPVPRWVLATMFKLWSLFYDVLLISTMRFLMKGIKCDGAELVACDLSYAHRETVWVSFMS